MLRRAEHGTGSTSPTGLPSASLPLPCADAICLGLEVSASSENWITGRALCWPRSRWRQDSIDQYSVWHFQNSLEMMSFSNDTHILSRAAPAEKHEVCFCKICFVSSKLHFICKVLCIWDFSILPFNLPFAEGRDLIFKGSFVAWHLECEPFLSLMFIMTYGLFM